MADTDPRAGALPGFEFMQSLARTAGATLPNMGQWVAPTLDPDEIAKRIEELRTVQFWLEQNARMIATTIQALEVQRMTLSTLRTMNVRMDDLRRSMTIDPEPRASAPPRASSDAGAQAAPDERDEAASDDAGTAPPASGSAVDPMQWWGALTRQFGELAASALQGGPGEPGVERPARKTRAGGRPAPSTRHGTGGDTKATATGKATGKRKTRARDAAGD